MKPKRRKVNPLSGFVFYFFSAEDAAVTAIIEDAGGRVLAHHGITVTHIVSRTPLPHETIHRFPSYPATVVLPTHLPDLVSPSSEEAAAPVLVAPQSSHRTSALLCDKYHPRSCADVLGQTAAVTSVLAWLRMWDAPPGPAKRVCLLTGPPGVGKSALAAAAAFDTGRAPTTIQAGTERADTELITAASAAMFRVLVVVENFDAFAEKEQAKVHRILLSAKVPIVCVGDDVPRNAAAFHHVPLVRLTIQCITDHLRHITTAESMHLTAAYVERVARAANGDLRYAMNCVDIGGAPFMRTPETVMLDALEKMAIAPNTAILLDVGMHADFSVDDDETSSLISSNEFAVAVFNNYLLRESMHETAACAEFVSFGDTVRKTWMRTKNYALEYPAGVLSCQLPMFRRGRQKINPSQWLDTSQMNFHDLYLKAAPMFSCGLDCFYTDLLPALPRLFLQPLNDKDADGIYIIAKMLKTYNWNRDDWERIVKSSFHSLYEAFKIGKITLKQIRDAVLHLIK